MTTNGILLPRLARDAARRRPAAASTCTSTASTPSALARVMRWGHARRDLGRHRGGRGGRPRPDQAERRRRRAASTRTTSSRSPPLTLERPWHVRFIETMPFGTGETAALSPRTARAQRRRPARASKRRSARSTPLPGSDPSDEARNYRACRGAWRRRVHQPGLEPYCGTCNRMRLTADGRFHLCLLNDDEVDVRAALRGGGGLDEVAAILLRAVAHKPVRPPARTRPVHRRAPDVPDRRVGFRSPLRTPRQLRVSAVTPRSCVRIARTDPERLPVHDGRKSLTAASAVRQSPGPEGTP